MFVQTKKQPIVFIPLVMFGGRKECGRNVNVFIWYSSGHDISTNEASANRRYAVLQSYTSCCPCPGTACLKLWPFVTECRSFSRGHEDMIFQDMGSFKAFPSAEDCHVVKGTCFHHVVWKRAGEGSRAWYLSHKWKERCSWFFFVPLSHVKQGQRISPQQATANMFIRKASHLTPAA